VGTSNSRVNEILEKRAEALIKDGISLMELLRRPRVTYKDIWNIGQLIPDFYLDQYPDSSWYQVEIHVKYEGYIGRAMRMIEAHKSLENKKIPEDLDYTSMQNIPREAKDKLSRIRPLTVGQASRISGISPADIQVLLIHLKTLEN
jgi:tRNA uridine 5-carboxymethylaminomethyl modification enzyme